MSCTLLCCCLTCQMKSKLQKRSDNLIDICGCRTEKNRRMKSMAAGDSQVVQEDVAHLEETRVKKCWMKFVMKFMCGRELCFLVALIFTAYAALQNGALRTRLANPPQKFFNVSIVSDYYLGSLSELHSNYRENDICFTMYYAPWDADSIEFRQEFEKLARHYHSQIFFAAINCWWTDGECYRKQHVTAYPVLVAHIQNVGDVVYRGPLLGNYIMLFLDNIISPLVAIVDPAQLVELQTKHEAVLLGFFQLDSKVQEFAFQQYYRASLITLRKDSTRQICFAVLTNRKAALRLKVTSSYFVLHFWNSTEVYPRKHTRADGIVSWLFKKFTQVTTWIGPYLNPKTKLSDIVKKGPTLVLFTPRSFALPVLPYFSLLSEVAMTYHNCNSSLRVCHLVLFKTLKRLTLQEDYTKLLNDCQNINLYPIQSTLGIPNSSESSQCYSILVPSNSTSPKCLCSACLQGNSILISDRWDCCLSSTQQVVIDLFRNFWQLTGKFQSPTCDNLEVSYHVGQSSDVKFYTKCLSIKRSVPKFEHHHQKYKSLMLSIVDDKVIKMVMQVQEEKCRNLKAHLKYTDVNLVPNELQPKIATNSCAIGVGPRTNESLQFVAVDNMLYPELVETLGIDKLSQHTSAVIIDDKKESHFILDGIINGVTLVEFIKNYTLGLLNRYTKSSSSESGKSVVGDVFIKDITTETFESYVLQENKDVILLYYTHWCGFCRAAAHVFLTVARIFQQLKEIVFVRINADLHRLPWKYTMSQYPSILFFPAYSKSEASLFPYHLQLTSANLLRFIVNNSQSSIYSHVAFHLCSQKCMLNSFFQVPYLLRKTSRELADIKRLLRFKIITDNKELNFYYLNLQTLLRLKMRDTRKLKRIRLFLLENLKPYFNELQMLFTNRLKDGRPNVSSDYLTEKDLQFNRDEL